MRKKTIMKTLAALLAATICMTACGNTEVSESAEKTDSAKESSSEVSAESSSEVVEEPKEYWEILGEVSDSSELPDWEGETLEVKFWVAGGKDRVMGVIPETNVTFKELERVTGVKFNVEESYGNGGDGIDGKLPKIIASKDYPTLVYGWGIDGQLKELYDNGYLADLTEYYENGDLWGVEYWMPTEVGANTLYAPCHTEDGKYYLIPAEGDPSILYETTGYTVEEYDTDYYNTYGKTPANAGNLVSTQAIWVRDDILTAINPDALTLEDIQNIYVEKGTFTKEEIFDMGLETKEDFFKFLRDIKAELADGSYVGLDGKAMEVTYGPNTETDNWDWLVQLPIDLNMWCVGANYFNYFLNDDDASTPLLVRAWEQEETVEFMRDLNALVNEDVISANSLVDNAATFTEKVKNAHYAVVYGNAARKVTQDLLANNYRPVYLSQLPDTTYGGVVPGGATTAYYGIFKDALTEEQLDQLVHALSYMASPVGVKMFEWGPASAGLFTEDADGKRTFNDPEVEANIVYRVDNEAGYKYGLKGITCSTQTLFRDCFSICSLGKGLYSPSYTLATEKERTSDVATTYFHPGVIAEYSYSGNATFINTNATLHQYGVTVSEDINEWWAARPGFEKQLTKLIVSDPADFDKELAELSAYSESVGLTDEAMDVFNQKFIEANKDRLDAAGIVY